MNVIKTIDELNAIKAKYAEVVGTRIDGKDSGKRDVLVCGGTSCTSSNSEKIIEKLHEERYRALLHNVEAMEVFKKSGVTMWECRNCGHVVVGTEAPEVCPVCHHPQSYFEVRQENY